MTTKNLQPGDPSYADVLNFGGDMQEYPDMANLKILATNFLRLKHPNEVAAVQIAGPAGFERLTMLPI